MAYTDKLPVLKNFAETLLTTAALASDTTLYVADADKFPSIVEGAEYVPCVIRGASDVREVVHITSIDTENDTVICVRGCEGTTAQQWAVSSSIYATLTAQAEKDMLNMPWTRAVDSEGSTVEPTYVSGTSFTLAGDWTGEIATGSAMRILNTNGYVATANGIFVASSVYSSANDATTITVTGATVPSTICGVDYSIHPKCAPLSPYAQMSEYNAITTSNIDSLTW